MQLVYETSCPLCQLCLGPWHMNRVFRKEDDEMFGFSHVNLLQKCYEEGWRSPAMGNDQTPFYCIGIIRSCCVLSVLPGLSCINKAMVVIKESVGQNEWDGEQSW